MDSYRDFPSEFDSSDDASAAQESRIVEIGSD